MNKLKGIKVDEHIMREAESRERDRALKYDDILRQRDAAQQRYAALEDEYVQLLAQVRAVEGITSRSYSPSVIEPRKGSKHGEATAMLMCSDWHPYEVVRPEQVNGMNKYTPEICKASVEKLFRTFVKLVDIERTAQPIDDCIVPFLGDIIGNMIRLSKVETNAGTPQEEELFVIFDLIIPGLTYLLEHGKFKHVYVKCSHGNHDRGTEKLQYDNMALHSHAWVVYHVVKRWFENSKYADRISFEIADGYHLYYNLYGRIIRQHHGDAFKYNGGIGGPTISIKRGIAQWETGKSLFAMSAESPGHADFDIFGHLHTALSDQTFVSCPSLIGYSPYSIGNKFPYEPPAQRMLIIDKKMWVTCDRIIYVR